MDLSQLNKEGRGLLQKTTPTTNMEKDKENNKKIGRPIKIEEAMDEKITLNFTKSEKKKILDYCEETGATMTNYIRRALKKQGVI